MSDTDFHDPLLWEISKKLVVLETQMQRTKENERDVHPYIALLLVVVYAKGLSRETYRSLNSEIEKIVAEHVKQLDAKTATVDKLHQTVRQVYALLDEATDNPREEPS